MTEQPVYEASEDTFLLWDAVKEFLDDCTDVHTLRFLDMGAGSGYLGFEAVKQGLSRVTFADCNPQSISYIQSIIDAEDLPCKAVQTDLFQELEEKYDVIVFNTPYLPDEPDAKVHDVALHGGEEGISVAVEFIQQAKNYLKPGGVIFLLASSLGNREKLELAFQAQGFQFTLAKSSSLFFETLLVYKLVRNDVAFNMKDQKHIDQLKKQIPSHFTDPHVLHRGKRGVVFQGMYHDVAAVIKLLRPDTAAKNAIHLEATYLAKANTFNIGPKLLEKTDTYVIMEYISGVPLGEFITYTTDGNVLRGVLTEIFAQLRVLDAAGLNKFELTNPYKHILVQKDNQAILIDFERMRPSQRPKNVTQFAQYVLSHTILAHLQSCGVLVHTEDFDAAIRAYAKGEEVAFEQHL